MSSQKIAPLLITICLVATLIVPCVAGDGVVMAYETIDLVHEKDQTAIILLSGGYQRMILSIDIDRSADSIWLFPVPACPDEIVMDHGIQAASLHGHDLKGTAEMELEEEKRDIRDFQLASFVPGFRYIFLAWTFTSDAGGGLEVPQVHQTLDKEGIHSEVVTTRNGSSLVSYLEGKGKEVPSFLGPKIDHYSGLGYSFIVSWINGSTEGKRPSIALSFPRTQLYYPMILTSAYGDVVTPVELIVLHHVKVTNEGMGRIRHKYYSGGSFEDQWKEGNAVYNFLHLSLWSGDFTVVSIDAKASTYVEDLVFEDHYPDYSRDMIWEDYFVIYLMVSLFLSIMLGILCSFVLFKKGSNERKVFGTLGILNFFAIWIFVLSVMTATWGMRRHIRGKRVLAYFLLYEGIYLVSIFIFTEYVLFKI